MNNLLQQALKQRTNRHAGLTLVELLIAMSMSTVVVVAASNLANESMEWRSRTEELRR